MVIRGQFLERPTLIPSGGGRLVLEGLSHRGSMRPPLLVLPPPPAEGGGMDHVAVGEIVYAASQAGFPTLRFNYRGVGASQGQRGVRPLELLEDALAALELLSANAGLAVPALASVGASDAVALRIATERPLAALALVGPTLVRPHEVTTLPPRLPVAIVVGDEDLGQDRGAWSEALAGLDGQLVRIAGMGRTYQRNLPLVGKGVTALLLSGGRAGCAKLSE